jgi:hypothetical protein
MKVPAVGFTQDPAEACTLVRGVDALRPFFQSLTTARLPLLQRNALLRTHSQCCVAAAHRHDGDVPPIMGRTAATTLMRSGLISDK